MLSSTYSPNWDDIVLLGGKYWFLWGAKKKKKDIVMVCGPPKLNPT